MTEPTEPTKGTLETLLPKGDTTTTEGKPFKVKRLYPSLEAVATLGQDIQQLCNAAASDPRIGLRPADGVLYLQIEVGITVDPSQLPPQREYTFIAPNDQLRGQIAAMLAKEDK
jgi:hypothetical protein